MQEGRWPATLTLQLRFMGGGADNSRFYTRSTAFPAPSLAGVPPPAGPAALDVQGVHSDEIQQQRGANLPVASASQPQHAGSSSSQGQQPRRPAAAAARPGHQQRPRPTSPGGSGSPAASGAPGGSQTAAAGERSGGGAAMLTNITEHRASGRTVGAHGSKPEATMLGAYRGAATLANLAEHRASGRAVGSPPQDALEAALRGNAEALCRSASALQPPAAVLVEVRLWPVTKTVSQEAFEPESARGGAAGNCRGTVPRCSHRLQ